MKRTTQIMKTSTFGRALFRRALLPLLLASACVLPSGCTMQQTARPGEAAPLSGRKITPAQQDRLQQAETAKAAGDYDNALDLFRSILEENPTILEPLVGMGEIYIDQEEWTKAEPLYKKATQLEPRNYLAQFGYGRVLQMLGKFAQALQAYQRAIVAQPDSAEAFRNIAFVYVQLDDTQNALRTGHRAVELDPDDGAARANLGAIYEKLNRNREAIEEYIAALELLEDNTGPVMLNLINVLAKEKRYREAANTAENLIRIDPSANAYERLGWALFRLGEYEQSSRAYRMAVEMDDRHWPSYNGIGVNALNRWLLSKKTDNEARREARDAFHASLRINNHQDKLITLVSTYNL